MQRRNAIVEGGSAIILSSFPPETGYTSGQPSGVAPKENNRAEERYAINSGYQWFDGAAELGAEHNHEYIVDEPETYDGCKPVGRALPE